MKVNPNLCREHKGALSSFDRSSYLTQLIESLPVRTIKRIESAGWTLKQINKTPAPRIEFRRESTASEDGELVWIVLSVDAQRTAVGKVDGQIRNFAAPEVNGYRIAGEIGERCYLIDLAVFQCVDMGGGTVQALQDAFRWAEHRLLGVGHRSRPEAKIKSDLDEIPQGDLFDGDTNTNT